MMRKNQKAVTVVGGGLAGTSAALELAKRGVKVRLYEMRPEKSTGAHTTGNLAELVCSNSLRSTELTRAAGVLKAELNILDSELLKIAVSSRVPAGTALAVDRELFSLRATQAVESNPNIELIREEVTEIPDERPLVIATGPLTSEKFLGKLSEFLGAEKFLHFFDAVAPLVYADSIDMDKVFLQSRYGKGEGNYINCPLSKEEFQRFYEELIKAEKHELKIKNEERYFEACLPIEEMAWRGKETLLFGPLKPVGLVDPVTGKRPFAVVQLRQDDVASQLYNMVGFQTNLKYQEQKRIFRMIPGLENADFARYGKMHLNTFIESNKLLTRYLSFIRDEEVFFAGQMTGSEGYLEAIATGLYAALNVWFILRGKNPPLIPEETMLGSLIKYLTDRNRKDELQPMHVSFGLLPPLQRKLPKKERYLYYAERAINSLQEYAKMLL
jgi:methylenetetrahydrofolate--tRNA-(uracil-5-)-methyltransferase